MTTVTQRRATPAHSGGWIAFSSESRVLVVGTAADDSITALWSAIGKPDGLQITLDLLTSRGLSATPPFAMLDWSGPSAALRVIVRGDVTVTVTHGGGELPLVGAGVSTWVERSIDGATAATLVVSNAVAAEVAALPLATGAAWIAALAVDGFTDVAPAAQIAESAAPTAHIAAPPAPPAPPAQAEAPATQTVVPQTPGVEIDIEATVTEAPTDADADADAESPTGSPTGAAEAEGYDYLFGDTMYRSVADAAVRDDEAEPDEAEGSAEPLSGDHDGHTVLTSDIAKLRGRRKPRTAVDAPPVPPVAPTVSLVTATGTREPLSQPILVGRAPSVSQVSGGKMPRLITVGGPDQDISRTHVRFALEGGTVVVTDLHSRNGTTVAMPGKESQKLRAGEPTSVMVGTVVDLGGGVTFTVDED
jgi:hypothetical protein